MAATTVMFLALGGLEFANSVQCLLNPEATATALLGIIPVGDANEAWARSYAFALWGLGSARIAYALNASDKTIWALTLGIHIYEMFFWWASSMEPGSAAAILAAQGVKGGLVEETPVIVQLLKAMCSTREFGEHLIHHVLLLGLPCIIALLLLKFPGDGAGCGSSLSQLERKREKPTVKAKIF